MADECKSQQQIRITSSSCKKQKQVRDYNARWKATHSKTTMTLARNHSRMLSTGVGGSLLVESESTLTRNYTEEEVFEVRGPVIPLLD